MQKFFQKNKKYLLFVFVVLIIGLITGILFFLVQNSTVKTEIINSLSNTNNYHYNAIMKDLIICSILLVLSFFVIGIPISIFYLFYEGLSLGFMLITFLMTYSFKGLIYMLIYIFLNKLIPLILMIFFIQKLINIGRLVIGFIIYRKDNYIKEKIILNFKNALYILIFILICNVISYFVSPLIFQNLTFLLES